MELLFLLENVSEKKGKMSLSLKISLDKSAGEHLLLVNPSLMNIKLEDGTIIESSLMAEKTGRLLPSESREIKLNFTSASSSVVLNWGGRFEINGVN